MFSPTIIFNSTVMKTNLKNISEPLNGYICVDKQDKWCNNYEKNQSLVCQKKIFYYTKDKI